MTLRDYVYAISDKPEADKIALAAIKLGVKYPTLYSWLHKTRKPGKYATKYLQSKGISSD